MNTVYLIAIKVCQCCKQHDKTIFEAYDKLSYWIEGSQIRLRHVRNLAGYWNAWNSLEWIRAASYPIRYGPGYVPSV